MLPVLGFSLPGSLNVTRLARYVPSGQSPDSLEVIRTRARDVPRYCFITDSVFYLHVAWRTKFEKKKKKKTIRPGHASLSFD